ncbi:c-type cytochrome [Comamonas odontotermitis]|uniref:c-type cytochrome n=1 Tax=Comamonas odontotermitis TaxID=379895 RepID=UPI003753DAAD
MKKHPLLAALACAVALSGFSTGASAQFAKAEDAIKYRQSALFVMAQHFGRVGAMANGKVPFDAKAAEQNADIVAQMAKLPWAGFDAAHEGGKAKPEIWKEQAKFKDLADKMQAETVKLAAAAKTGDLDKLKAAFGPAAASCKACHDDFRNR